VVGVVEIFEIFGQFFAGLERLAGRVGGVAAEPTGEDATDGAAGVLERGAGGGD